MPNRAEYPYDDYYLYVVFHKDEGRNYANLVPIDKTKNKRKTISYARYLMSVKEGRILNPEEQVDHIDNNKANDVIENLQILSVKENNIKAAKVHGVKLIMLKCPNCNTIFTREYGNSFIVKNKRWGYRYTACSRHCASAFGNKLQYAKTDEEKKELEKQIEENVISIFRSHSTDIDYRNTTYSIDENIYNYFDQNENNYDENNELFYSSDDTDYEYLHNQLFGLDDLDNYE